MKYAIEHNIALPSTRTYGENKRFPYSQMNVGDSFFVPCSSDEKELNRVRQRISSGKKSYKKTISKKASFEITTRIVQGGLRVWRTE